MKSRLVICTFNEPIIASMVEFYAAVAFQFMATISKNASMRVRSCSVSDSE